MEALIESRINWPDLLKKINEVANSVYELNDFFNYIEYSNYSVDFKTGAIQVSGTLSDPEGNNLAQLVVLEEAFKNYPRDPSNPDDTTIPYFENFAEFNSLSKTFDDEMGRYTSGFQLAFSIKDESPKTEVEE